MIDAGQLVGAHLAFSAVTPTRYLPMRPGLLKAWWLCFPGEHSKRAEMKLNHLCMTWPQKAINFTSAQVTTLTKFKRREHTDTLLNGRRIKLALKSLRDCYGRL